MLIIAVCLGCRALRKRSNLCKGTIYRVSIPRHNLCINHYYKLDLTSIKLVTRNAR
jgi:hypothetical protein